MADGINIPIDGDDTKIRGKLRRIKSESASAGRAFGQAQAQAARLGGPAGGALGRGVGGFQGGLAAGAIGLGATAVGLGLNALMDRDAGRIRVAQAAERRRQDESATARTVMDARDRIAAGGMQWQGAARRLISSGVGRNAVAANRATGERYGLSEEQILSTMEVSRESGVSTLDISQALATGYWNDPGKAAEDLRRFNGLSGALSATRRMSPGDADATIDRMLTDPRMRNVNAAGAAGNPVARAELDALTSGDTARVLRNQAADTLNPGPRLAAEAAAKAFETVTQLQAAAAAQSALGALLSEMGRVVGMGDGSAARALAEGAALNGN